MAETSLKTGEYGVNDMLRNGPTNILQSVVSSHPLEASEKNFKLKEVKRELATARNVYGLHMPIKLGMEKAITSKIHRLPGLQSSNLSLRTILGHDGIGPEDIFNEVSDRYDTTSMQL